MLDTKVKISAETRKIAEMLENDQRGISYDFMEQQHLYKSAASVIFSTLINFSVPIDRKMAALRMLKGIFQTAHPAAVEECQRILPVLTDIARTYEPGQQNCQNYLTVRELRPVVPSEASEKYVRFASEMIKQWGQYMEDLREMDSPYFSRYSELSRRGSLPSYFCFFTMTDYVQFMLNWARRKKKQQVLLDKIQIYHFLTNESNYSRQLNHYRQHLSENAETILNESLSILINHSIPVESKFTTLKSLVDLYHEANLLYCEKADSIISTYFGYIVEVLNSVSSEKYFEKIEKRLGVESAQSRTYISYILQIIKQWDRYCQNSPINPYSSMSNLIDKKRLLTSADKPIFNQQDFQKFTSNKNVGRHREPEYREPERKPAVNEQQQRMAEQIRRLQNQMEEFRRKEQNYISQMRQMEEKNQNMTVVNMQCRRELEGEVTDLKNRLAVANQSAAVNQNTVPLANHKKYFDEQEQASVDFQIKVQTQERDKQLIRCVQLTNPSISRLEVPKNQSRDMLRGVKSQKRLSVGHGLKMSEMIRMKQQRHYMLR